MEKARIKGDIGEDFVNQIAYKSLLKYWCYPNPLDEQGDKKEICDLLVLFKNICIIFSVKNYRFDGDFLKYDRKTIDKATKQISGAERKLFDFPREIYIKHPDRAEEKFERSKYSRIFRIIVNLGEGVDMYSPANETESGKFVTIFNKDTLQTILGELDTISDFVQYLTVREDFLSTTKMMQWFGHEKDVFALYIRQGRKFPPEFTNKDYEFIIIDFEGEWEKFVTEDKSIIDKKKASDKISYFLDEFAEKELTKIPNGDLLAQEFLSLNRFERRTFSKLFFDFFSIHHNRKSKATGHRYLEIGDYGVVFFYYSPDLVDSAFPETAMQTAIIGYTLHANYSKKKILGLGTTFEMQQFKFQFVNYDKPIDDNIVEEAKKLIKEFGWFKDLKFKNYSDKEYPS